MVDRRVQQQSLAVDAMLFDQGILDLLLDSHLLVVDFVNRAVVHYLVFRKKIFNFQKRRNSDWKVLHTDKHFLLQIVFDSLVDID
jgi:hypothetical protein